MISFGHKTLGLAFEEHAVIAAEVRKTGKQLTLCRAAHFAYPDGMSLDAPQPLGQAFGEFLKKHRFSASSAIAGAPARWLAARHKQFPPASDSVLTGMVRIEAERCFAGDLSHLFVDYDAASGEGESNVVLAALQRKRADAITEMTAAAGLKLKAITVSSAVLAAALNMHEASFMLLCIRSGHVELVVCNNGKVRELRHLSAAVPSQPTAVSSWKESLIDEITRHTAVMRQAASGKLELAVWNGTEIDTDEIMQSCESLSLSTKPVNSIRELQRSEEAMEDTRFLTAASLAIAGYDDKRLPFDFIHSRLALRKKTGARQKLVRIGAACAAIVAIALLLVADLKAKEREVLALRKQFEELKPELDAAREVAQHVNTVRGWTVRRQRFLEPLRELALSFPVEESIWVTSVNIREDMRTLITGRSATERAVLETLDRIRGRSSLSEAKLLYMHEAGANSNETAFSIVFDFMNSTGQPERE